MSRSKRRKKSKLKGQCRCWLCGGDDRRVKHIKLREQAADAEALDALQGGRNGS